MAKKAINIAYKAHKAQFDKSGVPYIFHSYEVAKSMTTEEEIATALLHDVVEDTNTTFEDLIYEQIPEIVIDALKLLTHNDKITYLDYINNLKRNPLAKKVKLAE